MLVGTWTSSIVMTCPSVTATWPAHSTTTHTCPPRGPSGRNGARAAPSAGSGTGPGRGNVTELDVLDVTETLRRARTLPAVTTLT